MNTSPPVQTLTQRRAIAAYTSAQRGADAARKAQIELERLLAAKRAGEDARAARYAASREYAMRCAERASHLQRTSDVPPAAPAWLAWTAMVALSLVLTLAAWSFAEYLLPLIWGAK